MKKNKKQKPQLSVFDLNVREYTVSAPKFVEYISILFGTRSPKKAISRMSPLRVYCIYCKMIGVSVKKSEDVINYSKGCAIQIAVRVVAN